MSGYGQSNFGKFSVKSDYSLSRNFSPPPQDRIRGEIRRTIIHDRHKMFLWRLAANCLPTKENISRFVNSLDTPVVFVVWKVNRLSIYSPCVL